MSAARKLHVINNTELKLTPYDLEGLRLKINLEWSMNKDDYDSYPEVVLDIIRSEYSLKFCSSVTDQYYKYIY